MPNNDVVITISRPAADEKVFLQQCEYTVDENDTIADWTFGVLCSNHSKMKQITCDALFILVNPAKLNTEAIADIVNITKGKRIFLWYHNTDYTQYATAINAFFSTCQSFVNIPFSHYQIPKEPIEKFLEEICKVNANILKEFEEIVKESIKKKAKPHLIALSILCQGYLAVHDDEFKKKLPAEVKPAHKLPENWWAPAFGDKAVFNETDAHKELSAIGKDNTVIENLFKEINNVTVNAAYDFLKKDVLKPVEKNAQ